MKDEATQLKSYYDNLQKIYKRLKKKIQINNDNRKLILEIKDVELKIKDFQKEFGNFIKAQTNNFGEFRVDIFRQYLQNKKMDSDGANFQIENYYELSNYERIGKVANPMPLTMSPKYDKQFKTSSSDSFKQLNDNNRFSSESFQSPNNFMSNNTRLEKSNNKSYQTKKSSDSNKNIRINQFIEPNYSKESIEQDPSIFTETYDIQEICNQYKQKKSKIYETDINYFKKKFKLENVQVDEEKLIKEVNFFINNLILISKGLAEMSEDKIMKREFIELAFYQIEKRLLPDSTFIPINFMPSKKHLKRLNILKDKQKKD